MDGMSAPIAYLRKQEWSLGNGQCPECGGVPESWFPHPLHPTPETLGHEHGCALAGAIEALGETPLYKGASKLAGEYVFAAPIGPGNQFFRMVPKGTPGYEQFGQKALDECAQRFADSITQDLFTQLGLSSPNQEIKP